jgi:Right handed beta helix region
VVVLLVGLVVVGDRPTLAGVVWRPPAGSAASSPEPPVAARVPAGTPAAAQPGVAAPAVPAKLVIVRTGSIDSVAAGVVAKRVARDGRVVTPAMLAAAVPPSWVSIMGDTVRLSAAVQLTAGTRLDVGGVRTLELAGGDDPRSSAFLATGRGQINLRGVTVASVDPTSGQPVAPTAAGRPYIKVSEGGGLTAADSTITDLGTWPSSFSAGEPAVSFGRGSTGGMTRTTLARGSIGLALTASQGVNLQDVTVCDSMGNGIVLRGDRATVLAGVRAQRNGDNGILVAGKATDRPITGITTTGNRAYGVSVSDQGHTEIGNLALNGDQAGGLELSHVSDSHVHHITTTDAPVGILLHANSTNLVLDTVAVSGGHRGVVVEKTTTGLRFTNSTIADTHVVGIAYDGRDGLLEGLTVDDCSVAVRVDRGSGLLTIGELRIGGGEDGLVASGAVAGIQVKNLVADGVSNDAIRSESPGMQIIGGQIRGGRTGLDLRAATTATAMQISLASIGVRAGAGGPIVLDRVTIDTEAVGVDAEQGSATTIHDSTAHALHAIRGDVRLSGVNDISLPPPNLLGVIGLPLILLALVLEFVHLLRQMGRKRADSREALRRWHAMATSRPGPTPAAQSPAGSRTPPDAVVRGSPLPSGTR